MRKLEVSRRAEAVYAASKRGLIWELELLRERARLHTDTPLRAYKTSRSRGVGGRSQHLAPSTQHLAVQNQPAAVELVGAGADCGMAQA